MALLLVFTASAASLALEAMLARYFALSQWHHLSFMVISVALLGFSASGTWLNLVATRWQRSGAAAAHAVPAAEQRLRRAAAGMAVSSVAMFLVLRLLPLDFFRIPSEPIQLLYLALSYLACAVPFFFAGLITAIAFAAGTARPGAVYAAAMSGSAVGVLLPVLLLPAAGLRAALMVPVALLLLPLVPWSASALRRTGGGQKARQWLAATALALALVLGVGVVLAHPALEPRPGPYKYLAHVLRFPDTRLLSRRDTARGRIDEVVGPTIRFAPGLSLGAGSPVPPQRALVRDGDAALFLVEDAASGVAASGWLDALHPAAALHLGTPPRTVLVLQEGGGVLLAAALRSARSVQVAEPSAAIARRLRRLQVAEDTTLAVVEDEPRALARRLVRSGERFDAVLIENWGASLAGTESHAQEPLLTVEAFRDYLALLEPEGVLSVSRRLLLPPANAPRLAAIAARALPEAGRRAPAEHLAMIRNWDSFTLLVTPQPLSAPRIERIRAFAAHHGFDLVSLPGLRIDETNRFNRLAEPFHAHAVAAVLESEERVAGGLVDLSPPTDDRPFFNRFVRWAQLSDYQRATGGRLYGLLLSGDVVALAVLAEALVLALVLLAVPWLRTGGLRRARAADRGRDDAERPRRTGGGLQPGRGAGLHPAGADADPAPHRGAGRPGGQLQGGARRAAGVVRGRRPAVGTDRAAAHLAGGGCGGGRGARLCRRRPVVPGPAPGAAAGPEGGVDRSAARSPGRGPRYGVPARLAPVGASSRRPRPGLGRQRLRLGGGRRRQHPARGRPWHHRPRPGRRGQLRHRRPGGRTPSRPSRKRASPTARALKVTSLPQVTRTRSG